MKKRILQILSFGFVAVVMASCASTEKTVYNFSEYRSIQATQSVATSPLIADLVVSEKKITYTERINTVISDKTQAEAKALADKEKEIVIANAMKANKADVLVSPIVEIQTDANGYLIIEVSAYPAVYKNFRNAGKEDMWILNQPAPAPGEKKPALPVSLPGKK